MSLNLHFLTSFISPTIFFTVPCPEFHSSVCRQIAAFFFFPILSYSIVFFRWRHVGNTHCPIQLSFILIIVSTPLSKLSAILHVPFLSQSVLKALCDGHKYSNYLANNNQRAITFLVPFLACFRKAFRLIKALRSVVTV